LCAHGLVERALVVSTVTLASIVLVLTVAGVLHDLRVGTTVVFSAIVCAVGVLVGARRPFSPLDPVPLVRRSAEAVRSAPFTATLAVLATAALAWRFVVVYTLPVYAYDALSYHIPTVAEWIRSGRLVNSPVNVCCTGYPANGELFFTWVGLLTGNDTWVDGVQIGFAALGAVATVGIGRLVGLGRNAAILAGSLFAVTPIVLAQSSVPYTDVIVAGLLLTSTYFLLAWLAAASDQRRATLLVLAGVAAGIAVGTKLTALPVAATMAGVVAVHAHRLAPRRRVPATIIWGGLFVGCVVALGGYWYLRDVIAYGNPIYPFRRSIGGHLVLHGSKAIDTQITMPPAEIRSDPEPFRVMHSWARDLMLSKTHYVSQGQRLGGLGPLWSYLGAWLTFAMAVSAWRRRKPGMLVFLLVVAVSFVAQPYPWWSRFTILLAAAGSIAIAHAIERLGPGPTGAAMCIAVIVLGLAGVAMASWRSVSYNAFDVLRLTLHRGSERTFGQLFYEPYKWLDAVDDTATIATDPRFVHLSSPLAGPRFTRRLLRLPTGGYAPFERILNQERPDYVIVRRGSAAQRWANQHDMVELPEQGPNVVAYRVPVH